MEGFPDSWQQTVLEAILKLRPVTTAQLAQPESPSSLPPIHLPEASPCPPLSHTLFQPFPSFEGLRDTPLSFSAILSLPLAQQPIAQPWSKNNEKSMNHFAFSVGKEYSIELREKVHRQLLHIQECKENLVLFSVVCLWEISCHSRNHRYTPLSEYLWKAA